MRLTLAGDGEGAELLGCTEACANALVAAIGWDKVQTVEPDVPEPTWSCARCAWCGNLISPAPDGCVLHTTRCPRVQLQPTTPGAVVARGSRVPLDDRGWALLSRVLWSSIHEFGHVDAVWCVEMMERAARRDR